MPNSKNGTGALVNTGRREGEERGLSPVVVFDFDGTLVDTLEIAVNVYNKKIAPRFKTKQVNLEDIKFLKNQKPSREFLKKYNVSLYKFPFMMRAGRKEIAKHAGSIKLYPGIKEMIKEIKPKTKKMGILTSNSSVNIKIILEDNGILNFFDFIYAKSPILKKHKIMKKLLKQQRVFSENVFYVGDEIRDIEAAKKTGIKSIAVTWGFNTKEALNNYGPDYLIEQPQDLAHLFEN